MFNSTMFNFLVSLFKNPKAIFISSILTKWYLLVMIPAIAIVYKIFMIMHNKGLFARMEAFVTSNLEMISDTVDKCLSNDINFDSLPALLHCL